MDPTSLVVGIIPLFKACFEIYTGISNLRHAKGDLEDVVLRLNLEMRKLRLTEEIYAERQLEKRVELVLDGYLVYVRRLMKELEDVTKKYKDDGKTRMGIKTSRGSLRFVAGDKDLVDGLLFKLTIYADYAWELVSSRLDRAKESYKLTHEAVSVQRGSQLSTTAALQGEMYSGLAKAAYVKMLLLQYEKGKGSSTTTTTKAKWKIDEATIELSSRDKLSSVTSRAWSSGICQDHVRGDVAVLIEWRGPFAASNDEQKTAARLDKLCELLYAMRKTDEFAAQGRVPKFERDANFGILPCLGWIIPNNSSNIGIIFELPQKQTRPPDKLRSRIREMHKNRRPDPALGDRFDIAFGTCYAVLNIIAVGWAHRSVRSENILVFDKWDARNVYLAGFQYSRGKDFSTEFSNLPNASSMLVYRPPSSTLRSDDEEDGDRASDDEVEGKNASYTSLGTHESAIHDLWGLGIVLLEIGLWKTVEMLMRQEKITDPVDFQRFHLQKHIDKLSARCGNIYCEVVRKCLSLDPLDEAQLTEHIASIIAELSECRA